MITESVMIMNHIEMPLDIKCRVKEAILTMTFTRQIIHIQNGG